MKNYYLCDIHHHTNNSFDAYKKNTFDINSLYNSFVGEDETNSVKLVCFTDHNYFNYDNYLTNYKELNDHDILCLPGIEVNTTNKVHWIFIFNNIELSQISAKGKLKGKLLEEEIFKFYNYNLNESILKQAEQMQLKPVDIGKVIDTINSISIEYIAIPHFDKNNGWYKHLKKDKEQLQLLEFFIKDNIVFGLESKRIKEKIKSNMIETQEYINYNISLYEQLDGSDEKKRLKLEEEIQRRKEHLLNTYKINECIEMSSVVYGSDYHGDEVYKKDDLFIMKSDLSFEGLKFALLDCESRIMSIEKYKNCLKNNNYVIDNITILENGVEKYVNFGDGLNCIIGSRGSGKTYFLSMLLGDTKRYNIINQSIQLKEIKFVNHSSQQKLTSEMVDYISQKNSSMLSKDIKPNIYDLLARAPYDSEIFEKELNNYFNQTPNSKNEIKEVIDIFNKIISEYNYLLKIINNKLDMLFIDSYNDYFKNCNENNEIYEITSNLSSYLKKHIENKNNNIEIVKKFDEIYRNYIKDVKNIFSLSEIKKIIPEKIMSDYLFSSDKIYKMISNEGMNLIKENQKRISLVKVRIDSIVQTLKNEVSNSQRILSDSMLNVENHIINMVNSLRKIKSLYDELLKYNLDNIVEETVYLYSQGESTLSVRMNKSININNLDNEISKEIFYNYNNLNFDRIIQKAFLNSDFGEYYFNNIYNHKDGRRNSYLLHNPSIQPSIFLRYDETGEKNWIDLSPGQRADILLNIILLNFSHKILIIDQPEDDLDNETIFRKIVKRIRELKLKRQIIVVTHNANMAITADCDYFVICESSDDGKYSVINDSMESMKKYEYHSINNENSSNTQTVLEIATEILDGGKEALKQRVKKIGYRNLFLE